MATNYPGSLDNFTNPTSASPINSPSHADQHSNANDAIEAIEGELGTNPKGAKSTVKARLDDVDTAIATKAPIASPTFTGTVTIPSGSAITGVPYLATANTFTGGVQQITTATAATVGLIVKATASQTASLMEWQNSAGNNLAYISTIGSFGTGATVRGTTGGTFGGNTQLSSAGLTVYATAAGNPGAIVRGFASQTANIQEWQNSSGTVLSAIDASGSFTSVSQPIRVAGSTYGFTHLVSVQYGATAYWKIATLPATSLSTCDQINIEAMLGAWTSTGKTKYEIMLGNRDTFAYKYTKFGDGATQARIQSYTEADGSVSVYLYSENAYTTLAYNITLSAVTSGGDIGATIYKNPTASTTAPTGTKSFDTGEPTTYIPLMNMTNAGLLSTKSALFNPTSASAVPLIVKAAASQTANLQQWQNSSASILAQVDAYGSASFGGNNTLGSSLGIGVGGNASQKGITIKGATSQTANLQEWQNSAGTVLAKVDASGYLTSAGLSAGGSSGTTDINATAGNLTVRGSSAFSANASVLVGTSYAGGIGLIIKGFASQTANLQEWQNSSGTVIARIRPDGQIGVGSTLITSTNFFVNNTISTTHVVATIRGAVAQTADLQQWQNSSGSAISGILQDGTVSIQRTARYSFNNGATGNERANISSNSNNELIFNITDGLTEVAHFYAGVSPTNAIQFNNVTGYPTANVFVIKGAASQSGDYFQIQNSGGTVLAQLNASNQFNVNYGSVYSQGGFRGGVNNHIGFAGLSGFAYSPAYLAIGARGAANQVANLQEWQNSAGTVLNGVNAVGQIFTGSTSPILGGFAGNSTTAATGDGTTATITTTGAHGLSIGDFITVAGVTPTGYNGTFYVTAVPTTSQISYANATTGAQTVAGTVTFAPQVSITPRSARTVGLVIKGASSQSNSLQQWQNSSGTVLASINNGGSLTLSNSGAHGVGGLSAGVMWYVVSGSSGYRPIVVQAATSQTGDLTAWQNSSGTVVTKVNAAGNIGIGSGATALSYGLDVFTGSARIWNGITGAGQTGTLYLGDGSLTKSYGSGWELYGALVTTGGYGISSNANLDAGGTTLGYGRLSVNTGATTTVGAVIRGVASQSANLQEWQNSAGTVLAKVDSTGTAQFLGLNVQGTGSGIVNIGTAASVYVGLIIKGVASQSANLQEWQDSSGTILSSISSGGVVSGKGLSITNPTNITNGATFYNSAGTIVFNVDTSLNAVNIGGGLSGIANNFASVWGYDSSLNAGYISFQTGALGGDSLAIRRTNHVASGDYTISTLGNFRLSTASGKNFNFNNGNIGIATTAIGTNNKIIVNAYSTVDNLATVQINTNAATNKGLVVQGIVSQTANLQEWQNSAGTKLAYMQPTGEMFSLGFVSTYNSYFYSGTADAIPLRVLGATSQTGDLQQWQNSVGTVLAKIASNGNATFNSLVATYGLTTSGSVGIAGGATTFTYSDPFTGIITNNGGYSATAPLFVVKSANVLAAGDLQQWQDSTGTVLAKVMSNGSLFINSTGTANDPLTVQRGSATRFKVDPYGNAFAAALTVGDTVNAISGTQTGIYANSASTIGLIIKGAASQTASLQEWHSNTGTVAAKVAQDGTISSISGGFFGTVNSPITAGNYLAVRPWAANHVPFTVKGYTAQTSDLTRWVNDAGTTLASITSNGGIQAGTYNGVIIGLNYPGIVIDTSNADSTQVWLRNLSATSKSGKFVGIKARGGYADAVAGDDLVTLEGQQYISSLGYASGKILISNDNSTPSATSYPARITLHTTAIGSTTLSERMRVDNEGLVGINMTPTTAYLSVTGSSSKDAIRLYSQGGSLAFWGGGVNNNLYTSGSMYMNSGDFAENAKLIIGTGATSNSGIVIRGVVGQTASLQEWQNSSANVSLAITPDGSIKGGNSSTISANTATTIDTVPLSSFTTIEYTISIKQGSKIRSSKVLVHTDGTSIDSTEYGIMEMGGGITGILVTASVSSTNSILQVTITDAATTNATVKLIKTML